VQVASLVLNLLLVLLAVALAFLAFKRTGGGSSVTLSLGKSPNSRYEVGFLSDRYDSRQCVTPQYWRYVGLPPAHSCLQVL
jgi:hypothetical protein